MKDGDREGEGGETEEESERGRDGERRWWRD